MEDIIYAGGINTADELNINISNDEVGKTAPQP